MMEINACVNSEEEFLCTQKYRYVVTRCAVPVVCDVLYAEMPSGENRALLLFKRPYILGRWQSASCM